MDAKDDNRFEFFFKEDQYLILKNYLYNYLLRKRAVEKCLQEESPDLILEVGSGISPIVTKFSRPVYSDLSFEAVKILKQTQRTGFYVVADGMNLPFKSNGFSHIISSEVLEHLENDQQALKEMARVVKQPFGRLIITVPHRKCYFTNDDDYVNHYRRYELVEIEQRLKASGLEPIQIQKVLGPLEKVTMILVVYIISRIRRHQSGDNSARKDREIRFMTVFANLFEWVNLFLKGYYWLDARIMPRSFSSVVLVKSIPLEKGY
jgi:ubiquinone/menaquinone biosynthesis C-methylase UbiE